MANTISTQLPFGLINRIIVNIIPTIKIAAKNNTPISNKPIDIKISSNIT